MQQAEGPGPALRPGVEFRPLAARQILITHPQAATQICDEQIAAAIYVCRGQPWPELMADAQRYIGDTFTQQEWVAVLDQVADFGFFEGRPKRSPKVRLFDPAPAMEFLVRRCGWVFSTPVAVALFALLFAGLWRLGTHWDLFRASLLSAAGEHPYLTVLLYYFCFVPIGLLHELSHGLVCRRFGGEVVEVGLKKDSANLYVLSNLGPLESARQKILYIAGGPFFDMLAFFLLVSIWLAWPNYATFLLLLPQAMFVLQFSYAMERGSDLSRIIGHWTGLPEAEGRWAFVKSFFAKPPKSSVEWKRTAIYIGSILLQLFVAGWLIWSVRQPVAVKLWPGFAPAIRFAPAWLYLIYRLLRKYAMNLPWRRPKPA